MRFRWKKIKWNILVFVTPRNRQVLTQLPFVILSHTNIFLKSKKVKFAPEQATKAQRGSICIALLFL